MLLVQTVQPGSCCTWHTSWLQVSRTGTHIRMSIDTWDVYVCLRIVNEQYIVRWLCMYYIHTFIYYIYTHAYIYAYAVTLIFMQNHLRHLWSSIGADAPPGGREVCGTRSTSEKLGDKSAAGKCKLLVWKVPNCWRQISQRYVSGVGRWVFWGIRLDLYDNDCICQHLSTL